MARRASAGGYQGNDYPLSSNKVSRRTTEWGRKNAYQDGGGMLTYLNMDKASKLHTSGNPIQNCLNLRVSCSSLH